MMLTPLRIEPISTALIARYTQDAPVRIEAVARDLGLPVVYDTFDDAEVAGKIVKDSSSPGSFTIYINARDQRRRQRFTLAHELGHFVLHRDLIGDGIIDDSLYRSKLGAWYERQAHRWAADTLMPAGVVRGLYRGGMNSFAELSNALDVSEDASRIRLNELGLAP